MKLKVKCPIDSNVMALSAKCMQCHKLRVWQSDTEGGVEMVGASCLRIMTNEYSQSMMLGSHKKSDLYPEGSDTSKIKQI